MTKEYKITYKDTEEKFIAFQLFWMDNAAYRKSRRMTVFSLLFIGLLGLVNVWLVEFNIPFFVVSCGIIFFALRYENIAKKSVAVMYRNVNKDVGWKPAEITVTLSEIDIREEGSDGIVSVLPWSSVLRFGETNEYFFLLFMGMIALVIPKNNCSSEQELEEIWDFIRSKTANKKIEQ